MRFSQDQNPKPRLSLSTIDSAESKGTPLKPARDPSLNMDDGPSFVPVVTDTSGRPQLARIPSTRYVEMLLHLDRIPRVQNIIASISTWILLAGFLVVPGTFTSFKNSEAFENGNGGDGSQIAQEILHSVAHIGLLWVSGTFCLIGTVGCLALWFRWRNNYVWLINRIFLPALLNSVAGLLTTVVNVYTAQKGAWSVTAKITAIVTSSCIGVSGALFAGYNFWILEKVKSRMNEKLIPIIDPEGRA